MVPLPILHKQAEPRLLPASLHPSCCPEMLIARPTSSSERCRRECPARLELPFLPPHCHPGCPTQRVLRSQCFSLHDPMFGGSGTAGLRGLGSSFLPATIFFPSPSEFCRLVSLRCFSCCCPGYSHAISLSAKAASERAGALRSLCTPPPAQAVPATPSYFKVLPSLAPLGLESPWELLRA